MSPVNDVVRSQSRTDVTTATMRQRLTTSTGTLTSFPSLPFDVIPEILCRLPVKLLLRLKCVCKSWKTLISDPKFAKKHLRVSKMYHHHHHVIMKGRDSLFWDSTISSIFSDASTTSTVPWLELIPPEAIKNEYDSYSQGGCISSCDGILLFLINYHSVVLWNPSIRTFKILPPLSDTRPIDFEGNDDYEDYEDFDVEYTFDDFEVEYTFGYDHFIDNYKVFAVTCLTRNIRVHVYTFGVDSWRSIDDFPIRGFILGTGMFVSGTVNWLVLDAQLSYSSVIVSLDLENESYRKLLMPDLKKRYSTTLGLLRDCLCIFANNDEFFNVWVMKEYGIKESWTKLFSVPFMGYDVFYTKVVYVFEDDQVLLGFKDRNEESLDDLKLVVYNSTSGTFKIPRIQNMNDSMDPEVYVESLISPCS